MRTLSPPREEILSFLESLPRCVVLRNHDIWASFARGGDVDLLVEDIEGAEEALFRHLGTPTWAARHSYVRKYAYPWGRVDLLPSLEWHGANYLPNQAVLESSEKRTGDVAPRPRLDHEALVSWFSSLLWGGFFKERYEPIILDAARKDGPAFKRALIHAAGRCWGERLWRAAAEGRPSDSARWAKQVRRTMYWRAFRREPRETLLGWLAFWIAEVRLRLSPPVPWMTFLGPDGSGKSSVISAVGSRLDRIFSGVNAYHFCPRALLSSKGSGKPVPDPHGVRPRGALASVLKLVLLFLDWQLGYWGRLVHLRAKGYLLLFDRNYHDILVDPKHYRYGGPTWLARVVGHIVPRPDLLVLLDAPPEVSQARKQEVPFEETRRQREAYLGLKEGAKERRVVDASKPLTDVIDEVEQIILQHVSKRSARRLNRKKGKP